MDKEAIAKIAASLAKAGLKLASIADQRLDDAEDARLGPEQQAAATNEAREVLQAVRLINRAIGRLEHHM